MHDHPNRIPREDLSPEDLDWLEELTAPFGPCPDCTSPGITVAGCHEFVRLICCAWCHHVYWSAS